MACIDNFITYRGSGVTPTTGLYVNDLYGVNLSKMDGVANTDYLDTIEFITRKIAMSLSYVAIELKRYVMPYFKLNSVVGHYKGGQFDEDLEYHTAVAADRGIRVDIAETTLSQILVNRVRIRADSAGDFNVVVTDGEETTNYPVTLVAKEEQDVEINQTCNNKRIYITVNNIAGSEGDAEMSCCSGYDIMDVTGWTGTGVSSHHYGLIADVTVICSSADLFCLMKDQLAFPVLYRFGIELAQEALETDRFNYFSLVRRDELNELLEKYKDDYDKEMKTVARTIPKLLRKLDDYCISCNQDRYIEQVP